MKYALRGIPVRCDRGHRDTAGVDVIGVVVAAELVVGDHDVGLVLLEQAREAFGGIVDGDVAEHVGPVLVLPVDHARVVVPEQLEMRDAERLARSLELAEADAGDLGLVVALISRLDPARCVAELAVRARDDNGSHALVRVPRQDAARARRLVVGVRVHGHQRQRRAHPASLSPTRATRERRRLCRILVSHWSARAGVRSSRYYSLCVCSEARFNSTTGMVRMPAVRVA